MPQQPITTITRNIHLELPLVVSFNQRPIQFYVYQLSTDSPCSIHSPGLLSSLQRWLPSGFANAWIESRDTYHVGLSITLPQTRLQERFTAGIVCNKRGENHSSSFILFLLFFKVKGRKARGWGMTRSRRGKWRARRRKENRYFCRWLYCFGLHERNQEHSLGGTY